MARSRPKSADRIRIAKDTANKSAPQAAREMTEDEQVRHRVKTFFRDAGITPTRKQRRAAEQHWSFRAPVRQGIRDRMMETVRREIEAQRHVNERDDRREEPFFGIRGEVLPPPTGLPGVVYSGPGYGARPAAPPPNRPVQRAPGGAGVAATTNPPMVNALDRLSSDVTYLEETAARVIDKMLPILPAEWKMPEADPATADPIAADVGHIAANIHTIATRISLVIKRLASARDSSVL